MERPVKILAVDDEIIVLDSIRKHLKGDSYSLDCVLSVHEALTLLSREAYDIILTDLMMPDIDGLEFIKDLSIRHPAVTIIMITGYASITTALQAKEMGAFDYIAKPFSKRELLEVVRRAENIIRSTPPDAKPKSSSAGRPTAVIQSVEQKTWTRLEDDGTATIGIGRGLSHEIDQIHSIVLPSVGDNLRQGTELVQLISSNMRYYVLMSPLSGAITEINSEVIENPELLLQDPRGAGWLLKILPSNYDKEISLIDR